MIPTLSSQLPIALPTLLETRLLVQANSGGGKSWALRRLLEQTANSVQQLVIDPEGEFATLREQFDYLIAAPHDGDALATPQTAALLARRLLESGVSAILDIYDLKAHERVLFVRRFLDALVNAPKALWHPVLIVLDEAHIFAPQNGSAESAGAVIDIATRGRKRGQCLVAATQRLSKLHKDVAAELGNKMIGRTGLDVDVKRAADELGLTSREATDTLRALAPGQFYVFGPALSPKVERITVGDVQTSHPKAGNRMMTAPPAPSPKLRAQLAKLADLEKEAEQEARTVEELKADNAKLRREATIANKRAEQAGVPEAEVQRRLREAIDAFKREHPPSVLVSDGSELKALRRIAEIAQKEIERINPGSPDGREADATPQRAARFPRAAATPAPAASGAGSSKLPAGERTVLTAIAQHPRGVTREQLTVLTGYKRSTRDAYLQRMREKFLITPVPNSDRIEVTPEGKDALGADFQPLPTGEALQQHWLAKLPEGESRILGQLCAAYPDTVGRDEIGHVHGYARSSRDAYLQRLKARQLVTIVDRGFVRAATHLFDGARS